jgi:hypothetical protein
LDVSGKYPCKNAGPWWRICAVLAYLFWHVRSAGVTRGVYEARLRSFHASLEVESASFRLDLLPFRAEPGYEDWYLVEDWAQLGSMNVAAVDPVHRGSHEGVASLSANGWGAVYQLVHGEPTPPLAARWQPERPGEAESVWQRQLVLGPAPEFCVGRAGHRGPGRVRVT